MSDEQTPRRAEHADIRIGTIAKGDSTAAAYIRQILPHGFESFQLTHWQHIAEGLDLERVAGEVREVIEGRAIVSSLGVFGNPLRDERTRADFGRAIDACRLFGCSVVAGFAGADEPGEPYEASLPRFAAVWSDLAKRAEDAGVRIAFENCDMGGRWERAGEYNIAHAPTMWERMFDAVPSDALGLEWEPCHQMVSLIDPIPQLRRWAHKIYHVHGKDATIRWDVLRETGLRGGVPFVFHRTPGFGDTNWADVLTELRLAKFTGCLDIEGWHDPVIRGDLEMTGQVRALRYLKECRGGAYVPNPEV